MPRFVPPITVEFAESKIDDNPVQPMFDIEEDAGTYMLVGTWENVDMVELEESVKVRDGRVKEMSAGMEGGKEEANKESNAREEHEGKLDRRRN